MIEPSIAELRIAARHARDLAEMLADPIGKQGFLDLSRKWEAKAEKLSTLKETEAFGSGTISFDVP
jgi:hypothetical protein